MLTNSESRHSLLYDKCRDTMSSLCLVSHCKDYINICFPSVGNEDFCTVQDVIVTVFYSRCLLSGSICTSIWLC
jgi:hypothetical protein